MKTNKKILTWAVSIVLITLACACPVAGMQDQANPLKTVQAGMTAVGGILTEIPAEQLVKTAQAAVTQIPVGQMLTQLPADAIVKTAQAGGLPQVPGLPTGIPEIPGIGGGDQAPEDIPLYDPRENYVSAGDAISYVAVKEYKDVLEFYKKEMPNKGWKRAGASAVEDDKSATLLYQKDDRQATIVLNKSGNKTSVAITIGKP